MFRKLDDSEKSAKLKAVPLFGSCTPDELGRLGLLTTEIPFKQGQVLCELGGVGSEFIVLLDGTASIVKPSGDTITAGPGDFFGELALLDGGPRTATVTMDSDGRALVLSGAEFRELLRTVPEIAVRMLKVLGERLRAADQPV